MVLAVGLGRYFYARAEMFKSADGAALAAAQDVDVRTFLNTGQIVLLPSAYGRAQEYAAYNSDYLVDYKIYPRVTAIRLNQAEHKVYVSLAADAASLFPAWLGGVFVNGEGEAKGQSGLYLNAWRVDGDRCFRGADRPNQTSDTVIKLQPADPVLAGSVSADAARELRTANHTASLEAIHARHPVIRLA